MNRLFQKSLGPALLTIVLVLSLTPMTASQNDKRIEDLFTERHYNFFDITLNCSRLVAHYYSTDQLDSVHIILDYWVAHTGEWSPTIQVTTLLAIDEGEFENSMITTDLIRCLMYFRAGVNRARDRRAVSKSLLDPSFDTVMQRVAYKLYAREEPGSPQSMICQFFAGDVDFLFPALQSERYELTPLGRSYAEFARNESRRQFQYLAVSGGAWIPAGARTTLGNHPTAGMQLGIDFRGYSIQLSVCGRFVDAPNKYVFNDKGTSDTTDNFSLLFVGFDLGKQLMRTYRHEIRLLLGIGGQTFYVVRNEDKDKQREMDSAVLSVGLGYRYYFKPYGGVFLAVEPRYELSKMNTNGGTDLSGSAFALRIAFGMGDIDYNSRGDNLKTLQYKY
jgi:hypothetical protein